MTECIFCKTPCVTDDETSHDGGPRHKQCGVEAMQRHENGYCVHCGTRRIGLGYEWICGNDECADAGDYVGYAGP